MDLKLPKQGPPRPDPTPRPDPGPVEPALETASGIEQVFQAMDQQKAEATARPEPPAGPTTRQSTNYLLRLFGGFAVAFLFFYCLADYTAVTTGQIRPGEMIFSNTMIQLWTATYRLVFIMGIVMALIALLSAKSRGLWQFFKPTADDQFDLAYSIKHHLTPTQRVWLFYAVFFFLCYLFVALLTAKLPESASVTP